MAGKRGGIEPGSSRIRLHEISHRTAGKTRGPHRARPVDRPEDRPGADRSRLQPRPQRLDGASNVTAGNRNGAADRFLIRLAPPDCDQQPGFGFLEVSNVKGYELGTAERAGKAEQE